MTARGSIPGGNGVFTELHFLSKEQLIGVPSLNDFAVEGTLNTNKQTNLVVGCGSTLARALPYLPQSSLMATGQSLHVFVCWGKMSLLNN